MIGLLQRVTQATVSVEGNVIGAIEHGLLVFIGVQAPDNAPQAARLIEKILDYRVFADDAGRMNRSLREINGGLLLVPQFTLAADTTKGRRASFTAAAPPAQAAQLFDECVQTARALHSKVATGRFGADMQVALINDGPVTFWLEV
jgi:D-aminoacyl-tRNA deacylase